MFVLTMYESWLVEVIETSALLIQDSRTNRGATACLTS